MERTTSFGYWVRRRRKALDLTQEELARRVACAHTTIKKIELDERRPSRQMAERLAECLAIPVAEREVFLKVARAERTVDWLPLTKEPVSLGLGVSQAPTAYSNNLPTPTTRLIGRKDKIAEICMLLRHQDIRLVTITGPGGVGKTRLALQAATELLAEYPDGVWLVELASLANPAWFAQKVASILGVHESIGKSLVDNLIAYLQHKHMLLLLDNCEHLIEACAQIVGTLIARCRHLAILATSREPLRVTGEVALLVSPLVTPDLYHLPSLKELSQTEAVDLFLDRARSVQSNFTLTMHNASAIAQICCRLDGIPLAIELAAARVRVLSAAQIAARLDDAFRLLVGGSRTAPTRQQTLQASLNWSHQLLYEKERVLFRRVAVFAGGFSLEAAEHICSGDGIKPCEVLDLLTKLVDKSLILVHEQGRLVRYHLLEMVWQYALVKFLKSSDEDEVRGRHLYFFLNLAEKYVNSGSPEEEDSLYHRLEMELENLRVALEWSRSALGHGEGKGDIVVEAGLRLAGSLWWFWYMRGYLSEGSEWLQIFLEKSSGEPNYARAKALLASGGLAWRQGRIDQAEAACTESLALCRTLGDKFGIAFSLGTLGVVAFLREDYAKAYSLHSEALAIRRELGINRYIAYSLGNLGVVVLAQGGIRQAEGLCEEGLTLSRKSRFQWTFNDLLNKRGIVALARGDYTLAVSLFKQSLSRQQEAGDRWNIAYSLEGIACVAVTQGKPERAAWIWGAAEALREVINSPLPPAYREIYELFVVTAKASLNEEAFKEVRSEGQELTMEQAIAFALA